MFLHNPLDSKTFSPWRISYLRCYFQDLFTSISDKCGGGNATYYSKAKHHFKVWICEHLGISCLTGRKVKIGNNRLTAIQEYFLCCNYSPSYEDLFILTRESNGSKVKIMESLLLIACDKPCLNKTDSSLPLKLFFYNISGYVLLHHKMSIYHIVVCSVSILCCQFCILSKTKYTSI